MKAILITTVLFSSLSFAQVSLVAPHPINMDPSQTAALVNVCAQSYRAVSGQSVSIVEGDETPSDTEAIELNLVGLGGKIVVNALRKGADGRPIHAAKMEASQLEDAVVVCERLAVALVNRISVDESRTYLTVTEAESRKRTRKLKSNRSFGVKVGGAAALADEPLSGMGYVGFSAQFEAGRWLHQFGAGALIPAPMDSSRGYGGLSAEIGTNYILSDTDFAPYVGAGLQPRLVFSGSIFNLVPYAQFGAIFSRTNSTRFFAEARIGQNLFPALTGTSLMNSSNATRVFPTELSLMLGLGF